MKYSCRSASEADYDSLYALHVATMRDAVEATWGWDDAVQQAIFRERWDPSEREMVVVDGEDVGVISVTRGDAEVFLELIQIGPGFQNRGIGARVIRGLVAETHGRGLPLRLHVLRANPAARRLYERLGFTVAEERPERYVMTCDPPRQ